jgi:hypothetical protein
VGAWTIEAALSGYGSRTSFCEEAR